jgi:hypothetical protein
MEKRKYVVRKQLNGPKTFRKWSEYAVGDIVIGTFVGKHEDTTYNKTHWIFKVEEAFFKTDGEKFVGKNLVINSCGSLDNAMEQVSEGQLVQIEYMGQVEMTKGKYAGKEAHSVKVDIVEVDEGEEDDFTGL